MKYDEKVFKMFIWCSICVCFFRVDFFYNSVSAAQNVSYVSSDELRKIANGQGGYTTVFKFSSNGYDYVIAEDTRTISFTNRDKYVGLCIEQNPYVDQSIELGSYSSFGAGFAISKGSAINAEAGFELWGCGTSVGFGLEVNVSEAWTVSKTNPKGFQLTVGSSKEPGDWYLYEAGYKADYVIYKKKNNRIESGIEIKNHDGLRTILRFLQKKPTPSGLVWIKC